jgi:hypothetical protein
LNGYVATASERAKAEAITRAKAPGYKVVNNIALGDRQ